jgi:hypothetical protein
VIVMSAFSSPIAPQSSAARSVSAPKQVKAHFVNQSTRQYSFGANSAASAAPARTRGSCSAAGVHREVFIRGDDAEVTALKRRDRVGDVLEEVAGDAAGCLNDDAAIWDAGVEDGQ